MRIINRIRRWWMLRLYDRAIVDARSFSEPWLLALEEIRKEVEK